MGTFFALSDTLFGQTRGAVLGLLYGHVGESYHLRQVARITGIALGPVQRELRQLLDAGLVTRKTMGNQTLYGANRHSPVFAEVKNLVAKTVGIPEVLLAALQPLQSRITLAFVPGRQSTEAKQSGLDLILVGKISTVEVVYPLSGAQKTLNRQISPTVYTVSVFKSKVRAKALKTELSGKKLFVIGDENTLRELARG